MIAAGNVRLIVIVKLIHGVRVSIKYLDIVNIVVTERFLNLIEKFEALLQLLVQLDMVNGLLHFSDLYIELFLLLGDQFVKCIAALSQGNLEIHLSELELVFIVVHSCSKIFVETDDIVANLTHLENRVIHVVDRVRVERL